MSNFSIASIALFAGFSASIWAVVWLAAKGVDDWGWILFVVLLFFGSVSIKHSDMVECPKCGERFEAKAVSDSQ